MKNPLTPAGIEPAIFRYVAQHLNHCATAVPPPLSRSSWIQLIEEKMESDGEVRRVPAPHHTTALGHYPIVLIRWLQLTEVCLYLIYPRNFRFLLNYSKGR